MTPTEKNAFRDWLAGHSIDDYGYVLRHNGYRISVLRAERGYFARVIDEKGTVLWNCAQEDMFKDAERNGVQYIDMLLASEC
jgi:hypothetical protein